MNLAVPFVALGLAAAPVDLTGAWSGRLSHDGQSALFALELEPAGEGKVFLKLSIPAVRIAHMPMGEVPLQVQGDDVTVGPFSFKLDSAAGTLSGTMPAGLVPTDRIPVTLQRAERLDLPSRPEPDAPAAQPVWTFETGAPLWPGAAFADGVVYAGSEDGVLHALDARTGRPRWSFKAEGAIRARAALAGGVAYIVADDGILYALDAASGKERWQVRVGEKPAVRLPAGDPKSRYDRYGADVAVAAGRLYVGTHDGHVLALDAARGERLWDFAAGDSVLAAPAVANGRVYAGSFDKHVYALEVATGRLVWKHDTRGPVVSTPAVDGDRIVVGSRSYDLLGLDANMGQPAWTRYFWFSWIESSARVRDGIAYVGSSDTVALSAFEVRSGRPVWETDVWGWAWGQPAVTQSRVYIGAVGLAPDNVYRGAAWAVDRATGRPAWRFAAAAPEKGQYGFAGSPAVGAGHVFFTGLDGKVDAFAE